ncbi:hypothetical protein CYK76_15290 [Clostridium perfringens]|nr:hypothetical protein CYK76_15290 [Clostridium perfringens]PWX10422.1 hypothetical protein CYK69_15000 [Clostridium perfringens]PWX29388.1 hypothetical protein CYK93_14760 [Clostridium perfringens]PWX30355.1 hypothetical protein CYK94_15135 [Clostridium perfringens]PWX59065.1 hypothetical protein CYK88_07790 [Clostridium perfringens]
MNELYEAYKIFKSDISYYILSNMTFALFFMFFIFKFLISFFKFLRSNKTNSNKDILRNINYKQLIIKIINFLIISIIGSLIVPFFLMGLWEFRIDAGINSNRILFIVLVLWIVKHFYINKIKE